VNGECCPIFVLLAANIPAHDQKSTRYLILSHFAWKIVMQGDGHLQLLTVFFSFFGEKGTSE